MSENSFTNVRSPVDAGPTLPLWPNANLFRNPFGELTRQERAELAVVDLRGVIDGFASADGTGPHKHRAVQYIGDCGRGKTTRMLAFLNHFPEASYVYLPEDEPCPSIPDGNPLLIDEAQRMPRRVCQAIFATGVPLVLATHRDLSRRLRRAGYIVHSERIGLTLSAESLAEMLNRRIKASRRDPRQAVAELSVDTASELIRRFGTDIRAVESYLYDVVQSQVHEHAEMRFID